MSCILCSRSRVPSSLSRRLPFPRRSILSACFPRGVSQPLLDSFRSLRASFSRPHGPFSSRCSNECSIQTEPAASRLASEVSSAVLLTAAVSLPLRPFPVHCSPPFPVHCRSLQQSGLGGATGGEGGSLTPSFEQTFPLRRGERLFEGRRETSCVVCREGMVRPLAGGRPRNVRRRRHTLPSPARPPPITAGTR